MALDNRRELFAHEYIKDINGAAAARRIGISAGSARSEACRMLAEPEVQELIADLIEARNAAAKITAAQVINELAHLALFDPVHAYDESTNSLRPIHDMPEHVRKAIAGVEVLEVFEGRGNEREHIGNTVKVKFTDRGAHLERLMKHLGLMKEPELHLNLTLSERLNRARSRTTTPDDGSDLAG